MAETSLVQPCRKFALTPWRFLVVAGLIAFAIAAAVAVWFTYRIVRPVGESMTQKFLEYVPTAGPTDGILETATASAPESFTRTDSAWIFNVIPLGTTVSEIRVPAVYRYHIDLYDAWKLATKGDVCIVMAPQFNPSLPPAIVTDQMEKSTSTGWLRFNGDNNLDALERDITRELNRRADDQTHRNFVREACRHSVAEFVKDWLIKEDYWRTDRFHQIVVLFPDEVAANERGLKDTRSPSITFDDQSNPPK